MISAPFWRKILNSVWKEAGLGNGPHFIATLGILTCYLDWERRGQSQACGLPNEGGTRGYEDQVKTHSFLTALALSPHMSWWDPDPRHLWSWGCYKWGRQWILMRTRPLPCSEYTDPVQSQMSEQACGLTAVSSAVQSREGSFYRSPSRQRFYNTTHLCSSIHTPPSPALSERANSCRESVWCNPVGGCYTQDIRLACS